MPTKSKTLALARKWLGTHEKPDGSNRTPIGVRFGWNGVPWCAEALWVVLTDAGFKIAKNASASGLASLLAHKQGWRRVAAHEIQGGDAVKFYTSHIGLCEARRDKDTVITLEGNHLNEYRRVARANGSIAYGIRPPYTRESTPPPAHKPPPTTKRPYPGHTVARGSSGSDVKWVQAALNRLTGAGLTVDGDFGLHTLKAVQIFQRRRGLVTDGIVGPKTWAALS